MSEVSIIISARNEYPQIVQTINALMVDMAQSGIDDWEIIIADNGSTDPTTRFFKYAYNNPYGKSGDIQVIDQYKRSMRGLAHEGRVRFCYDPVFSNVGARHRAVQYARYKNIIFADGHIAVKAGTIKYALETLENYGGSVHMPVAWMGASIYDPHPGYQYTYKVGEKIWGTWNYAVVAPDKPFYIPLSGHCFLAVNKAEYLDFGGYDTNQRVYGGGENYLDTLYWLLGSHVMLDPRGLVFHLSAGRGYSYDMSSLIHNMILTAYTLGGEKWAERIYVTYLDKPGMDLDNLNKLYSDALTEGKPNRDMIAKRQKMSFEELLCIGKSFDCDGICRGEKYRGVSNHALRPWDKLNNALHGRHLSFVTVFEDWLTRLKSDRAKAFISNSPFQKL